MELVVGDVKMKHGEGCEVPSPRQQQNSITTPVSFLWIVRENNREDREALWRDPGLI